jgi:hypothetical protein
MINAILISLARNALLVVGISALVLLNAAVWADDSAVTPSCLTVNASDTAPLASPAGAQGAPPDRARL